MAFSSSTFSTIPAFLYKSTLHAPNGKTRLRPPITATLAEKKNTNALQYRKLGDSDLEISEITMGTVRTFVFWPHLVFLFRLKFVMK